MRWKILRRATASCTATTIRFQKRNGPTVSRLPASSPATQSDRIRLVTSFVVVGWWKPIRKECRYLFNTYDEQCLAPIDDDPLGWLSGPLASLWLAPFRTALIISPLETQSLLSSVFAGQRLSSPLCPLQTLADLLQRDMARVERILFASPTRRDYVSTWVLLFQHGRLYKLYFLVQRETLNLRHSLIM